MSNTISDNLIRLNNAKTAIAQAITAKGGIVNSGDGFEDFATDIDSITSITSEDNGKVVSNGSLISQTSTIFNDNGTYDTTTNDSVTVAVPLTTKSISSNGTYIASSDNAKGYTSVSVSVPNSYTASDEGKVVNNNALISQTSASDSNINTNGTYTYDTTYNNSKKVIVAVPNTYTSGDEGKVVSNGALVSQTSITKTVNGTYDTTLNNQITVNVPTYSVSDAGKVVSTSGALVNQTAASSSTITSNGTYNYTTTYNNSKSVTVNVSFNPLERKNGRSMPNTKIYSHIGDWETKSWSGMSNFYGNCIFNINGTTYYMRVDYESSSSTSATSCYLSGNTWYVRDNNLLARNKRGNCVWANGSTVYLTHTYSDIGYNFYYSSPSVWTATSFTGLSYYNGFNIWSDGTNIYYSNSDSNNGTTGNYTLDTSTSTWASKTWNGLTSFDGSNVWTDGENIYYSNGYSHYILNKSTSTWTSFGWGDLSNFYGKNIWTDGINIYYSNGYNHYILINDDYKYWVSMSKWSNYYFSGENIWTDGSNIYVSQGSTQYVLTNKSNVITTNLRVPSCRP